MSFPTLTLAAATAAMVSLTLAGASLAPTAAPRPAPQTDQPGFHNLPVDVDLDSVNGRHVVTLTVPPGLDTATLGLAVGPMTGALGRVSISPTGLLPNDVVIAGASEITRTNLPANAPSTFQYQLTPAPNALGEFVLWTTAQSEALTSSGETRRLRFPTRIIASVRTRLDLDSSGTIDEQDFVAAAALIGAGDPSADLDGDGITSPNDLVTLAEHMGMPVVEMNRGTAPASNALSQRDPSDAGIDDEDIPDQFGGSLIMVSGGGAALQNAINAATSGDTLSVGPGTYTPSSGLSGINVTKPLTIVSTSGAGSTFIAGATGVSGSVAVHIRASNVVFKGFTITGGGFGVLTKDLGGSTLSNITLSELVITTQTSNPGHGVLLENTTDSRVDEVTVNRAQANGILIDENSMRNVVNHCNVLITDTQHAYAIKNSHDNIISHCNATAAAADSCILLGSDRNTVQHNTFSGHFVDGIVLTDDDPTTGGTGESSDNNCIQFNVVSSTGLALSRGHGTGIWMNSESNSNLVLGNVVSGHPENGIAIFNADDNVVEGNWVTNNGQGGVIVWDAQASGFVASRGGRPTNNLIRGNDFYDFPANGGVNVRDAVNTTIEKNFVRSTTGAAATVGVIIDEPSPPSYTSTNPSSGTLIVGNTFMSISNGLLSRGSSTGTKYYQNKHFTVATTTIYPPADVTLDADVTLGGNHWSGFAASGNPSRITPFTDIVVDVIGTRGGGYSDRYPWQSESLGKSYTPTFITPDPTQSSNTPDHVYTQGGKLLIQWKAEAGVYVDIAYSSTTNATFNVPIVSNAVNTGYYLWTIPNVPAANDYFLTITIKDSEGTTKATANSTQFGIAQSGLTLISPSTTDAGDASATFRIHYNDETASNIAYMTRDRLGGSTAFTVLGTNTDQNREYVDITLPATSTRGYQVGISNNTGDAFSATEFSDGRMAVRKANDANVSINGGADVKIDNCYALTWLSPPSSVCVDIEFYEGAGYRTLRSGLKDTGTFYFNMPEFATIDAKFRVTFKSSTGSTIQILESGTFDIVYSTTTGTAKPYFRFYNLLTQEHLYTTLIPERDALNAAVGVWLQEADQGSIYNGPATLNGVKGVPYYRLLNTVTLRHLWTTDRNEYFTLRETFKDSWIAEGVDGYLLPTQTGNAIPLYRLRFATGLPLQHWTTDLNEYNTLPERGWVQEGIVGYLLP